MKFVNLTPHIITLNGGTWWPPSGQVARVETQYTPFNEDHIAVARFGAITGLPEPVPDTMYIVSGLVAQAATAAGRYDVVSPATGHPEAIRESGQITSVPGFIVQ